MLCRIGICDDNKSFREKMEKIINDYASRKAYDIEIHTYESGESLIESCKTMYHNIVFLDVEMGEHLSGIETAQQLRKIDQEVTIIFVTSYEDFALEAYRVSAKQYLVKPVKKQQVELLMDSVLRQICINLRYEEDGEELVIKRGMKGIQRIPLKDILYISKERNIGIIHTVDGDIHCYDTLKSLKQHLDPMKFVQINRGEMVNWSKVKKIQAEIVFMDGIQLQISRGYMNTIHKRYKSEYMKVSQQEFWERF